MTDLKQIIAKNISSLRREAAMTQFELAEKLNYSDKAVSKWERGESIPDVAVLKAIADIFSVSVDYLLCEEHGKKIKKHEMPGQRRFINHGFITGMAIALVWLVAILVFVTGDVFREFMMGRHWLIFIWAVPMSLIVWLVFNSVWFNPRHNFIIVSLLMWSALTAIHLSLIIFLNVNVRFIYLLGVPGQVIIFFWSGIKK